MKGIQQVFKVLAVVAVVCLHSSGAANILAFFLIPSYSHQIPMLSLSKALAARGHNVTVITPNASPIPIPNHTEIDVSFCYQMFREGKLGFTLTRKTHPFSIIRYSMLGMAILAEAQMKSPNVQHFLSWAKDVKWDVVLYENMWMPSYLAMSHFLGAPPVIGLSTIESNARFAAFMGSPLNLAYAPLSWPFTHHMTFYERLYNVATFYWFLYTRNWLVYPRHDKIIKELFGDGMPSSYELERNQSLLIHCADSSLIYPQAYTPNVVHIGPTHIEKPKPLPEDLKAFVSGADVGVIYFSLGSNMQGTLLPVDIREAFLSVFSRFPDYRVVWKWESDSYFPGQPNMLFKKWVPQQDLLAHPNVKLFITQGGLQSLQETIHFGVPIIGIPLVADQNPNVRKLVYAEAGISLDFDRLNNETIFRALNEVLSNPKYTENMKRMSAISRDKVLTPIEEGIRWVEYVIRYNGVPHLRPATLDLHWSQYLLLDVAAFIITVTSVLVFVVFKMVQLVYRKYACRRLSGEDTVKKYS